MSSKKIRMKCGKCCEELNSVESMFNHVKVCPAYAKK